MLIDTRQIISKTQLRNGLSKFIALTRVGKTFVISDRGELTSLLLPFDLPEEIKRKVKKGNKRFDVVAETRALRKKLSAQNPNFDSLKALREIRNEN